MVKHPITFPYSYHLYFLTCCSSQRFIKEKGSLYTPKAQGGVEAYLYPSVSLGARREWSG
jgi:hypothetical protein